MEQTFTARKMKNRGAVWLKEKIFSEFGVFQIWEFPKRAAGGWKTFNLQIKHPSKNRKIKRSWWFGWNGERLSKNKDMGLLNNHKPKVYQWVEEVLHDC